MNFVIFSSKFVKQVESYDDVIEWVVSCYVFADGEFFGDSSTAS